MFEKIKAIRLPEGNMKSLSIGGTLLWQKQEQEETVQVSGTWQINQNPTFNGYNETIYANFMSNSINYARIIIVGARILYMPLNGDKGDEIEVYDSSSINSMNLDGWTSQAYRTIAFDGVQTVSKEFYNWLVANAVKQKQLDAPTIRLNGDTLTIWGSSQDNPVEDVVIFVDGVEMTTVEVG